jgi:multiple sugar transport system ATP-binding protein
VRELAQDVGDDRTLDELASGPPTTTTLVGRFDSRTRIREGDRIEVSVDHEELHFFDPDSGLAIK